MSRKLFGRSMKFEIKPCPFCGRETKIREVRDALLYGPRPVYTVRCGSCNAGFPRAKSLKALVERWNRRVHVG